MKVLFDHGVPAPLRSRLNDCEVTTAFELGWHRLSNGELIAAAEQAGFEVLVTTDRNLKYQQNLAERQIGVLVLMTTSWPRIEKVADEISQALSEMVSGDYREFEVP
jgi:hypothetical protein